MAYRGPDRRVKHVPHGLAKRYVNEETAIDLLDTRKDDTADQLAALRTAGKAKLLEGAGFTTERAAQELSPLPVEAKAELTPEQVRGLSELNAILMN